MAEKIVMKNGQLQVSDRPIIPFIEGDGVGHDIWKNAQAIFDKAEIRFIFFPILSIPCILSGISLL